tara:strand:+ start:133 stop:531 length:399 start_codon:yes stop_codon:yes gene_type:complete
MKFHPLIPVGAKIKVDKSKIENQVSKKLLDNLPQIINGEVLDYKMTDGMSIGYILRTENNLNIWIFNNELNEQTKKEYNIDETSITKNLINTEGVLGKYKVNYEMHGNRNIKTLFNPINLISWLIFTLKDIF